MLQLLAPASVFEYLSVHDTSGQYNTARPYTANDTESNGSISSVPSSHRSFSLSTSRSSRRSSQTSYSSTAPMKLNIDVPRLTKTPWELDRHKRHSLRRRTEPEYVFPATVFKTLPREVYDCIVEQLGRLHLAADQTSPAGYLKDLCNLSVTSRAWDRAATLQMYRNVWVLTNEDHPKMPKLKVKGTGRLKLLRRTLRKRNAIARCVRELHLSDIQALYDNASIEREEIANQVASLVMVCPNLERLVGFHIPYTHSFDRLSHALSTRLNLKEKAWIFSENSGLDPDEEEDEDQTSKYYHPANDPTEHFLELNSIHPDLTTLVLHQQKSRLSVPLTFRALIGTMRQFPSLRHLSISGFPASSFSNLALNALPHNLQSLRLENLPGINEKGLQRFAASLVPTTLQSLKLIDLEIGSLTTVATFLSSNLPSLIDFTLSQYRTPLLPSYSISHEEIPTLSSNTIETLHWELRSQASPPPALLSHFPTHNPAPSFPFTNSEPIACLATSLLATCIKNGKFPALQRIRAPHDPQGLLQSLCKPLATALLPGDMTLLNSYSPPSTPPLSHQREFPGDFDFTGSSPLIQTGTMPPPIPPKSRWRAAIHEHKLQYRADSATSSPCSADFPAPLQVHRQRDPPYSPGHIKRGGNLHENSFSAPPHSRMHAQARILAARKQPAMLIKVFDEEGNMQVCKTVCGFMGALESEIAYEIRTDKEIFGIEEVGVEGWGYEGDGGWVVGIRDVVGGGEDEEGFGGVDGLGKSVGVMALF